MKRTPTNIDWVPCKPLQISVTTNSHNPDTQIHTMTVQHPSPPPTIIDELQQCYMSCHKAGEEGGTTRVNKQGFSRHDSNSLGPYYVRLHDMFTIDSTVIINISFEIYLIFSFKYLKYKFRELRPYFFYVNPTPSLCMYILFYLRMSS